MRELRDPSRHVASSLVGDALTSLASWSRRYFLLVVALPFAAAGVAAALWLAPLRARAAARTPPRLRAASPPVAAPRSTQSAGHDTALFPRPLLGCINTDFCNQILIFLHF